MADNTERAVADSAPDPGQDNFEAACRVGMNPFVAACERLRPDVGLALMWDARMQRPVIWSAGHRHDVAAALAGMLRDLKAALAEELES